MKNLLRVLASLSFVSLALAQTPVVSLSPVSDSLNGKTSIERSDTKGTAIVSADPSGTATVGKYSVEIQHLIKVPGGIQLYARAFINGQQVGFGKDGSVDLEKFTFINPPILVPDPIGPITRIYDLKSKTVIETFREDPAAAIREALTDTIRLTGKEGATVESGKIGHSTLTVYPDAVTTTTSDDAYITRAPGGGGTFSNLRDGAGTSVSEGGVVYTLEIDATGGPSGVFNNFVRGGFGFDTSSLGSSASISAATISLFGNDKLDSLGGTPSLEIYSFTPASNTTFAAADFTQCGATAFSTDIAYSSLSTTAYNDLALNASGLANISKTGVSNFCTRDSVHDVANSAPPWSANNAYYFGAKSADTAGTTNDPKLVVTYTNVAASLPQQQDPF